MAIRSPRIFKINSTLEKLRKNYFYYDQRYEEEKPIIHKLRKTRRF